MGREQWTVQSKFARTRAWVPCSRDSAPTCCVPLAALSCSSATTRSSGSLVFRMCVSWKTELTTFSRAAAAAAAALCGGDLAVVSTEACLRVKSRRYLRDLMHHNYVL